MAAGDVKQAYGSSSAITITCASLASDTNLLAGRESDGVVNTTTLALDYLLGGKIRTGTSPTTSRKIEIWVVGTVDDTPTYPDVFDGTDSNETVTSADIKRGCAKLVTVLDTNNTSDRDYWFGPISIAALFGGTLPKRFVVFVVHNTGVNLNSTGGNHVLSITPIYATVAQS